MLRRSVSGGDSENQELGFLQDEDNEKKHFIVTEIDGKVYPNVKWNYCKEFGHFKCQYPKLKDKSAVKEYNLLQLREEMCEKNSDNECEAMLFGVRFNFFSESKQVVHYWLLLIDTGSTCSMIKDSSLMTQILKTEKPLDLSLTGSISMHAWKEHLWIRC